MHGNNVTLRARKAAKEEVLRAI